MGKKGKKDARAWQEKRFKAIEMWKNKVKQTDIAHRLMVTPQAVHGWIKLYKDKGRDALRRKKSKGRPRKFSDEELESAMLTIMKNKENYRGRNDVSKWSNRKWAYEIEKQTHKEISKDNKNLRRIVKDNFREINSSNPNPTMSI